MYDILGKTVFMLHFDPVIPLATPSFIRRDYMFGERIKELRNNHTWTQQELGDRLGVSKQSVSNWENGNIMPSIDVLVRMSDLFQTSTDYILNRENDLTLDITDLDSEQKAMVQRMVRYFRNINKTRPTKD